MDGTLRHRGIWGVNNQVNKQWLREGKVHKLQEIEVNQGIVLALVVGWECFYKRYYTLNKENALEKKRNLDVKEIYSWKWNDRFNDLFEPTIQCLPAENGAEMCARSNLVSFSK